MEWILYLNVRGLYLTCVLLKGFEPESFPVKFNPPKFEYMIHSVEVDLYYFTYV